MPFFERDGVKLFYADAGAGDPPFVFVHGWTCDHSYFAPQFEHFRPAYRVLALDLRGHGESDAPDQDYTIGAFADDVAALCTQAGVARPVVVGHSMGGTVVLELAARYPELPRAVVMVDAAPITASTEAASAAAALAAALRGPDHAVARAAIADNLASQVHDDAELRARISSDMAKVSHRVAASCVEQMTSWDGEAAARACRVPALHIAADQPINDAAALRALNPRIRTGQTVGAGHFNQLEVPDQVNAMIERFLAVSLERTSR
jgi:pimeloyl-ACP methyl ester carboxylesterase